jgi:predicted negative regulator of RcsB-dependent stress response
MVMKIKPKKEEEETATDAPEANKAATAELLKEDEFLHTSGVLMDWLQTNARTVLGVILGIFGLVALGGLVSWNGDRQNLAASEDLAKALKPYHRPVSTAPADEKTPDDEKPFPTAKDKWTASKDALKPVADKHKGTSVGTMALLYLADTQLHLGEFDAAVEGFQAVVKATPATDNLRFLSLQGLAHALEGKGDLKGALAAYKQLAAAPGKLGADYGLYQAGRTLFASKDDAEKTEGRGMLEKLSKDKDFEFSSYKSKATDLLGTN